MKKFLLFIFAVFICVFAYADTVNLTWKNGDTTYDTSSCTIGDDLMVPSTPPTKPGYTFVGWQVNPAKELKYVSFKKLSFIDTGIKFDSDEIEYDVKYALSSGGFIIVFGAEGTCSSGNGKSNDSAGILGSYGADVFDVVVGGKRVAVNLSAPRNGTILTDKVYIKKSTKTASVIHNGGSPINDTFYYTITSDKNIRIGNTGLNSSTYCSFEGKIYYFRIKKDGVLVLDLIPAKDPDGVVCFYDRVSKTFFYNQYGPNLTAGPEVQ